MHFFALLCTFFFFISFIWTSWWARLGFVLSLVSCTQNCIISLPLSFGSACTLILLTSTSCGLDTLFGFFNLVMCVPYHAMCWHVQTAGMWHFYSSFSLFLVQVVTNGCCWALVSWAPCISDGCFLSALYVERLFLEWPVCRALVFSAPCILCTCPDHPVNLTLVFWAPCRALF